MYFQIGREYRKFHVCPQEIPFPFVTSPEIDSLSLEPHIGNGETLDNNALLDIAIEQAELGLSEGGVPIGAAIFSPHGQQLSAGRNRRVQHNDPAIHAETDAFRRAGRQRSYRDLIMVTTLAPCWYCTGLVRQFGFRTVIVGESINFAGGLASLRELGVNVIDLASPRCVNLLAKYIREQPAIWSEDIGVTAP